MYDFNRSFQFSHLIDFFQHKVQLSDQRQEDYDGQLNYEYIKLISTAKPSTAQATHR